MVIDHRNWLENNIKHKCKTVKDFIDNELMKIENKEKKYFIICLKEEYVDKKNLVLYFQDGKLKSHHSTMVAFDYNDVLECEIQKYYSMFDITIDKIVSIDCDSIEEIVSKLIPRSLFDKDIDIDTLGMTETEKNHYILNKMFEEYNIIETIRKESKISDDIFTKCLNLSLEKINESKSSIRRIEKLEWVVEQQAQQIKWLSMQNRV